MFRVALGVAFLGCAPSPPTSVRDAGARGAPQQIAGHVGLHQFADGSHAWATFADPVAVDGYHGDDPFGIEPPPTLQSGACSLHPMAPLQPAPLHLRDAGEIRASGATPLRMWFTAGGYATDPAPGRARLFFGGEHLAIVGGSGDLAFDTTVTAPTRPQVTAPVELHVPSSGALTVAWDSESSPTMVVVLTASSPSGDAFIRCATSDVGTLTIAHELLSALPAPPRELRLDVERFEERLAPTRGGTVGVLVRLAHTTWIRGTD